MSRRPRVFTRDIGGRGVEATMTPPRRNVAIISITVVGVGQHMIELLLGLP
jgi:hypothetical protein